MRDWRLNGKFLFSCLRKRKKVFFSTDIDGSGTIDWNEFLFSILGDDAGDYGLLADLDTIEKQVDVTCVLAPIFWRQGQHVLFLGNI